MTPIKTRTKAVGEEFIAFIEARGFLHQLTDRQGLADALKDNAPAYIGYDATASSLHVGSLISIMLLRWYQAFGFKPIILMGGGTTKVGDPSGKDETRQLLAPQQIDQNIEGIKQIFSKFIQFGDKPSDAMMVNNADWLDNLNYIEFLRDYGRHFSINRMLSFDSVRLRLDREQTLSFLEFNYMILQAYDFLELSKRHDCILQMGGSDQWGNIVNGIELARRIDGRSLYGLTTPLLTTASGQKMGKTANGAIWLNNEMLSAYDYWQFWRNIEDADVPRFLKLFTELPLEEVERLSQLGGQEINEAKKILADAATTLCHGNEAANQARMTAEQTFEQQAMGDDLPQLALSPEQFEEEKIGLLRLLVLANLAASNGEARRFVDQGAVRINRQAVKDHAYHLQQSEFSATDPLLLSCGRKKHVQIIIKD